MNTYNSLPLKGKNKYITNLKEQIDIDPHMTYERIDFILQTEIKFLMVMGVCTEAEQQQQELPILEHLSVEMRGRALENKYEGEKTFKIFKSCLEWVCDMLSLYYNDELPGNEYYNDDEYKKIWNNYNELSSIQNLNNIKNSLPNVGDDVINQLIKGMQKA